MKALQVWRTVAAALVACLGQEATHKSRLQEVARPSEDSRLFQKLQAAMMESCSAVFGLVFVILVGGW